MKLIIARIKQSSKLALLAVKDWQSIETCLLRLRRELGGIISAFEFWDASALEMVLRHANGARSPFAESTSTPFYLLIESQTNTESDQFDEAVGNLLETHSEAVQDAIIADTPSLVQAFWHLREGIPEACSKEGKVYKYDVTTPLPQMYDVVEQTRKRLANDANVIKVTGYGHLGDGIPTLFIFWPYICHIESLKDVRI